jgi:ABC-type siderophore export system fused ATPase/permease subunit
MQRIEKFLAEGEVPEWASSLTTSDKSFNKHKLGFENARLEWPTSLPNSNVPTGPKFTLGPLDIEIPRERLTLICGGTSSGKSALLLSRTSTTT